MCNHCTRPTIISIQMNHIVAYGWITIRFDCGWKFSITSQALWKKRGRHFLSVHGWNSHLSRPTSSQRLWTIRGLRDHSNIKTWPSSPSTAWRRGLSMRNGSVNGKVQSNTAVPLKSTNFMQKGTSLLIYICINRKPKKETSRQKCWHIHYVFRPTWIFSSVPP